MFEINPFPILNTELVSIDTVPTFKCDWDKKCVVCKRIKSCDEFGPNSNNRSGLHSYCRVCDAAKQHQIRLRDKTAIKNRGEIKFNSRPVNYKHCPNCEVRKHRSKYYLNSRSINGLQSWCIECVRTKHRDPLKRREQWVRREVREKLLGSSEKVDYAAIAKRDGMVCYLCLNKVTEMNLSFDHVVPLFKDGKHAADNIKTTHLKCNIRKGTKTPEEYWKMHPIEEL